METKTAETLEIAGTTYQVQPLPGRREAVGAYVLTGPRGGTFCLIRRQGVDGCGLVVAVARAGIRRRAQRSALA